MKKYFYFTLFFITTIVCEAQSPIYDISDVEDGVQGSYYKDLNGVLDGYDGTYLFTNGTTTLKIVLKKKILSKSYYYRDLIVGEFQFIKNGVELNNTLDNIKVNYTDERPNHRIKGSRIITGTAYGCPDCSPTEKRLRLSLVDNKSPNIAGLDIRKTTVNGVPAIKVSIFGEESAYIRKEGDPASPPPSIELGDYLMIKQ